MFQFDQSGFSCGESTASMGRTRWTRAVWRSVFHQRVSTFVTGWAHHHSMSRCQRIIHAQRCDDCNQGVDILPETF